MIKRIDPELIAKIANLVGTSPERVQSVIDYYWNDTPIMTQHYLATTPAIQVASWVREIISYEVEE